MLILTLPGGVATRTAVETATNRTLDANSGQLTDLIEPATHTGSALLQQVSNGKGGTGQNNFPHKNGLKVQGIAWTHVKVLVDALEVEFGMGRGHPHGVDRARLDEVHVRNAQLIQLLQQVCVQRIWMLVLGLYMQVSHNLNSRNYGMITTLSKWRVQQQRIELSTLAVTAYRHTKPGSLHIFRMALQLSHHVVLIVRAKMWFFNGLDNATLSIFSLTRDHRILTSRKPPKGERRIPTLSAPTSSTTALVTCNYSQTCL